MVTPILLPKQGNTVETCLIVAWKKHAGDDVKKGEIICEVETDKAVFEIESPADGTLLETFFKEGDDVPVLTNIAVIGTKGEKYEEYVPAAKRGVATKVETGKTGDKVTQDTRESPARNETAEASLEQKPANTERGISPRAKKLAEQLRLSTTDIAGTGPGNRIVERDILSASKNYEPLTPVAGDLATETDFRPSAGSGIGNRVTASDMRKTSMPESRSSSEESIKVVQLKGVRKIIAGRMLESLRNSAQLTLNSSADATAVLNLRKRFKNGSVYKEFQSVTINDMIHYAVIRTLPDHPELNSLLLGEQIEYHSQIHLGFAVDTPRGLMVPVIKNALELNLLQLSVEAKRLANASQSGKIDPEELNGATFTVTNLGALGIESFTPVLNLPQTGILGVNAVTLRPVESGDGILSVPHIAFSLTIDHRVIDGAVGARFLQSLARTVSEIDLAITSDSMRR